MLMCDSAEALIVREADGELMPPERDLLERHTAGCAACQARREANLAVKAVLARRVDAEVPRAFAARVAARVGPADAGGWLAGIDWRRRTEWMLPVAAGLALLVVVAGGTAPAAPTESASETAGVETTAAVEDELAGGASSLTQDMTSEELLAAMLGAPADGARGAGDGR